MRALVRWSAVLGVAAAALVASCSGGDDPDPVEPQPDPTGSIRASVTGDGSALASVTVRVFADGGSAAIASGATAANGQVTFDDLDTGAYDVEVVIPSGYELAAGQAARLDVTVAEDQTATVTFALEEIVVAPTEGQIRVQVTDGASNVQGIDVNLYEEDGTTAIESGVTNANGQVVFGGLAAGTYDVEIELPTDYEIAPNDTVRKAATVTLGATTAVAFEVDGPDIVTITASGTSFTPSDVTITPGTTVRWVVGAGVHTVTPDGHTEWSSVDLNSANPSFEHTFDSTGEFDYFCQPHQNLGMTGIIRVQN